MLLLEVPHEEREALFVKKLRQCYITFDFRSPGYEVSGKESKSAVMRECIDFVTVHRYTPFSEEVYPEIFNMVT
jgi:serine/threonine-protein phosphatase 2A regulatory subunit B'